MNQCEISIEFSELMKRYEKDFMNSFKLLEEKQINFFQGGRSIESALNKLEILKNQINKEKKEKNCEEKNGGDNGVEADMDIDNKSEKEENDKEMMEKMEEIL